MRILLKNKIVIGCVCLIIAALLAFGLLPRLYNSRSATTEVVRLNQTVEYGTVIDQSMLTLVEVGAYGLSGRVATSKADVIGKVAATTVYADENLLPEWFMSLEDFEKEAVKQGANLEAGQVLITVSFPTVSSGIAGLLRSGDSVDVYEYATNELGQSVVSKALAGMTVYDVLNSKLISLDGLDAALEADETLSADDYDFVPAYVIFIANEQQAKALIKLEREKSMHLTLLEAGDR